jgi:hypothetical protein
MNSKQFLWLGGLLAAWMSVAGTAAGQLKQQEPDPLARMRAAAASNQSQACTIKEPSACAEATPKIVNNALGSPQLAENLQALSGAAKDGRIATWAESAFRASGVDDVHAEEITGTSGAKQVNVVAEIHGREKPGEFVVVGARLPADAASGDASQSDACNAVLVIEAARDVHLTGLRPLRSIRFILFASDEKDDTSGSRGYVQTHRGELDHAVGAAIFERGCGRVDGFSFGGRHDIEPGVRETFAVAPIDSWHVDKHTYDAPWGADNFDFLLEGVPTLLANREPPKAQPANGANAFDLDVLKHNAAIAGVLAFALAEHPAPLGPRQSRAEIAGLLKKSSLEEHMNTANIWQDWDRGQRGRQP